MGKKDPFALGPVQRRRGRRGGKTGRVREFFHGKLGGRENCAPGGVGPTKEGREEREGGRDGDVRKLHDSLETRRYSSILQNHGITNTN